MHRLLLVLVCLACGSAAAGELVHPFPPAGPAEVIGSMPASKVLRAMQRYSVPAFTDILALHVASILQGSPREPFTVVRKPRQVEKEAANYVAASVADGRTLLLASAVPYQSRAGSNALELVGAVATMPYVLIVRSEARARTLVDLIDVAGNARDRVLVATPGERSAGHVGLERLRSRATFPLDPVAYNGGQAALNALVSKQVRVAFVPLPAALPYVGGGRLEALAIAQPRRHARIPEVLTTAEAGIGVREAAAMFQVFAPGSTPLPIVRELRETLARALDADASRELITSLGLQPFASP